MSADIEKAYLQINVEGRHRDFLSCLCFKNVFHAVTEVCKFRFCRVIFGAAPSQFLLNATVRKLAEQFRKDDPDFVRQVEGGFYVDDLCRNREGTLDAYELYKKIKVRFSKANFNVRKWVSNDQEFMKLISEEEGYAPDGEKHKVLGIFWDPSKDTLNLGVREVFEKAEKLTATKRNVLKSIASIFDPVGYLQNIVVSLKILFQEICVSNVGWDDVINCDLQFKWKKIMDRLKQCQDLEFKRHYFSEHVNDPIVHIYLHGFSDASEVAYVRSMYIFEVYY